MKKLFNLFGSFFKFINFFNVANVTGATHLDDMFYIFSFSWANPKIHSTEFRMINEMVELWTSFAISGVPEPSGLVSTSTWTEVVPYDDPPKFLKIFNDGIEMVQLPNFERLKVWNEIYRVAKVVLY